MPRGRGRPSRPVARSQTREDHTTTPRWRATARIVLFSRERPVSRIGQKKGKSTTCEPSMLQRSAWSRPPRRQRSASTSSPRRPVTRPFFHGLAPQQHTRLRALGPATPAVAVDAQQAKQRNAGALVQHRARVPDHAWMACRGSWFSSSRCGAACWPKFWGVKERARHGLGLARVSTGELGWYYVHAEGSGATSQARGQVTDTRGSHNDAALAS